MDAILYNEFCEELLLAQECINSITEIDPLEEIFEAESPEVKKNIETKVANNEKAKLGVVDHIVNAAKKLLEMIMNMLKSVKEFFFGKTTSELESNCQELYKAAVAKDPSIKNKKVQIPNIQANDKTYNGLINQATELDKKLRNGESVNMDGFNNSVANYLKGAGATVLTTVGIEAALNWCSSTKEGARMVYKQLEEDKKLQEALINSIGDKKYNEFKKDVKAFGVEKVTDGPLLSLRAKMLKLRGYKCDSLEDAFAKTYKNIFNTLGAGVEFSKIVAKNTEVSMDPSKNKVEKTLNKWGNYIKNSPNIVKQGVTAFNSHGDRIGSTVLSSKEVKKAISYGKKISKGIDDVSRSEYLNNEELEKQQAAGRKAAEKRKKAIEKDKSNQSILDSITGGTQTGAVGAAKQGLRNMVNGAF